MQASATGPNKKRCALQPLQPRDQAEAEAAAPGQPPGGPLAVKVGYCEMDVDVEWAAVLADLAAGARVSVSTLCLKDWDVLSPEELGDELAPLAACAGSEPPPVGTLRLERGDGPGTLCEARVQVRHAAWGGARCEGWERGVLKKG